MSYQLSATPQMDIPASESSLTCRFAVAAIVWSVDGWELTAFAVKAQNRQAAIAAATEQLNREYPECWGYLMHRVIVTVID